MLIRQSNVPDQPIRAGRSRSPISASESSVESVSSEPLYPVPGGQQNGVSANSDSKSRARAWCFTLHSYTPADELVLGLLLGSGRVIYYIQGREVCPTTGRRHLQGFVYFRDGKTLPGCKSIFRTAHWEASGDSANGFCRAIEYCRKENQYVEGGVPPKSQVVRGKLGADAYESALSFAKRGDFDSIPPAMLVRYYATFKAIRKDYMIKPVDSETCCGIWIQGIAGCGKSLLARALAGTDFYRKMRNHWWDGYQNETFAICDDMDKFSVSLGGLLKDWTDRYSFTAEAKGGAMSIRPRWFIVTSQYSIGEIWDDRETAAALLRRCFVVNFFDSAANHSPTIEDIATWHLAKQSDIASFV